MGDSLTEFRLLQEHLKSQSNSASIRKCISQITALMRENHSRDQVVQENVDILEQTLLYLTKDTTDNITSDDDLLECYRCLRNICGGLDTNQDKILPCIQQTLSILQNLPWLKRGIHETESEKYVVLLRCISQFLGNSVSGHHGNQTYVWEHFTEELSDLLNFGDSKLTNYTCMILHNCLRGGLEHHEELDMIKCGHILTDVVSATVDIESEFGIFVVEDCLQIHNILQEVEPAMSDKHMLFVLEILIHRLKNYSKDNNQNDKPAVSNIHYIATQVVTNSTAILSVVEPDVSMNPDVVAKHIEILGLASSHQEVYGSLQDKQDLLTTCLYLLHSIHRLGQCGNNAFSSVEKVTELHHVDVNHPAFGLKADLIRVLANMVHRHKENQNKVREMDGIALILDQTSIDGRNPYISQWAIFAIHNLCEENMENQYMLASLKSQGISDRSAVIEELGIQVEMRGDKVYVKPNKPEDR